jgi:hypothetical protein
VTAYLEAIQVILNPAKYIPATSPVEGWQIEQSGVRVTRSSS